MKRKVSIFLAGIVTAVNLYSFNVNAENINTQENTNINTQEESNKPELVGEYAVSIDYETGEVLYDKNKDEKLYPASTTKVWTAYLVIKHVKDLDAKVKIDYEMPPITPTILGIKTGETYTVRELLEASLIKSCNDATYVLGRYISGTEEKFTKLMTEEAHKIGAKNTNFVNTNGLPDDNHYSTAYDMVLLARESLKSKTLRDIVKKESTTISPTELFPEERTYTNGNKFINDSGVTMQYNGQTVPIKYDIVDGLKTGFTNAAGRCLLSTAEKDGSRVVVGVFKSKGDTVFLDSRKVIDYSLDNFKVINIFNAKSFLETLNINKRNVDVVATESYSEILNVDEKENDYEIKTILDETVQLPIKQDDKLGQVEISKDGNVVKTIDLVSKEEVLIENTSSKARTIENNENNEDNKGKHKKGPSILVMCIIALISVIIYILVTRYKNKQKYAQQVKKKIIKKKVIIRKKKDDQ